MDAAITSSLTRLFNRRKGASIVLPGWFVYLAISIRILGGFGYFRSVLSGKSRPNPITWFIWGLTPMIAFAAQLQEHVGIQAWMTFALGVTPMMIFVASIFKARSMTHFTPFNISCGLIALAGVVLWRITDQPLLAILFSILADIFGGIPTVIKSFRFPQTEYFLPYLMSVASMAITLLTIQNWQVASYAFPGYIMLINTIICAAIIAGRIANKKRPRRFVELKF